MSEVATISKAGMKKSTKTIIIVAVIMILIILAALGYYFYVYKPAQLKGLPTTKEGLTSGQKWNNNGTIEIIP